MANEPLTRALDRLYTAPLEGFLPLRKQLVAELRASGDAAGARAIGAVAKPTRTAWALNQVARSQPDLLQALLQARGAAAAPSGGDADHLRRSLRDYRERLNDVVRAAGERLATTGAELNAQQTRRLAETLQTAAAEEGEARAALLAGTLTHDVSMEDPFAGVAAADPGAMPVQRRGPAEGHAPHAEPRPRSDREDRHELARKKADEEERARREQHDRLERQKRAQALRDAKERVDKLQAAAHAARVEAHVAQDVAAHAARKAQEANEAAKEAEGRLEAARADMKRLA